MTISLNEKHRIADRYARVNTVDIHKYTIYMMTWQMKFNIFVCSYMFDIAYLQFNIITIFLIHIYQNSDIFSKFYVYRPFKNIMSNDVTCYRKYCLAKLSSEWMHNKVETFKNW